MNLITRIRNRVVLFIWKRVPNCVEMARLSSENLDRPLGIKARIQMRFHFLICAWCSRYAAQIGSLRRFVRSSEDRVPEAAGDELTPDAKHRIKETLISRS